MPVADNLTLLKDTLPKNVTLVAVSKTKPNSAILEAYETGHRIFGENKVQELTQKYEDLPKDISWHMIGHLQTNKVKFIAPFVHLIHGIDSLKLLKEVNKQAAKHDRVINCLLQIHIAEEDTKFGFSVEEAQKIINTELEDFPNVSIVGLMGMATNTNNETQVRKEFSTLHTFFKELQMTYPLFTTLSMGMSGDYKMAIDEGSNMVRVGSAIFGSR